MRTTPSPAASRRGISWGIAVVVGYVVLAAAEYFPAVPWSTTRLPNGGLGDPAQAVWFLEWARYALVHLVDPFTTDRIDVPFGVNLASNTSTPLLGLLALPVTATLGPVSAFNVLIRLAMAASASSMWAYLRTVCTSRLAPVLGGLFFGFGPYMATEVQGDAHLDLAFVAFVPLVCWAITALVRGTARPVRAAVAGGLAGGAQVLIAPEVLVELAVVLLVGLLVGLVVAPRSVVGRLRSLGGPVAKGLAVFAAVAALPAAEALFGANHLTGPVQQVAYLQAYRGDLLGPIVPTAHQLLAPPAATAISDRFAGGNITEAVGYLSAPLVALVVLLVVALRRHRAVLVAFGLMVAAFVLSLGSRLTVSGHVSSIALPESLLARVPLLQSLVPARFALIAGLFAAVLVSVGLDRLFATARIRPRWSSRASAGLGALLLVLSAVALVPQTADSSADPGTPDATALLAQVPTDTVVLTSPYPKTPWVTPMLWQALDRLRVKLVGGYATVNGPHGAGVATAPLLTPPSVQEFLAETEDGTAAFYPPVAPADATAADLCAFIARYRVGAVLDAGAGVGDDGAVRAWFTRALGAPSQTSGRDALWLSPGRCASS